MATRPGLEPRRCVAVSFVVRTMTGSVLVHPVLLLPRHPPAAWDLARRAGPIQGTGLGTVAECLEPMADFRQWLPGIDDHLHRHPTAPDAGSALGRIGPWVEPAGATLSIDPQGPRGARPRATPPPP